MGGIITLLQELKVHNVIISKQREDSENFRKIISIVNEKNIKLIIVKAGDRITFENDLYMDILWPNENFDISQNLLNNNAIVGKLIYRNFSMLFTGDIEAIAEKQIIEKYKNLNILKSTILKVAHHGSKSSSTEEFLKEVNSKYAIIGVGKDNKFGHPNDEILKRIERI